MYEAYKVINDGFIVGSLNWHRLRRELAATGWLATTTATQNQNAPQGEKMTAR